MRMRFGIGGVCTEETLRPAEVARRVEELGLESLFLGEHTHIPWSRESAYPLGELPRNYWRTLDPFVALTDAAAASSRIRLGTAICQLAQRDPIVCAKEVASVDVLSDGRFEFAVGAGWNLEEMRNHGTNPSERFAMIEDRVKAMCEMWAEDEATYHGPYVEFDRIAVWPKPVQKPHPPVLLAGNGPSAERRVLDHADGWAPVYLPDIPGRVRRLQSDAGVAGRKVSVTIVACPLSAEEFEELEDAGVDRCLHWVDSMNADDFDAQMLPFLTAIEEYGWDRAEAMPAT
jgi:probable F420-dependent oxidoreductase